MRAERPAAAIELGLAITLEGAQPHLHEWLAFHREVGVGHFYFYDTGLTTDRLALLQARDDCTVIPWPPRQLAQAFHHARRMTARRVSWLILLDDTHYVYAFDRPLPELLSDYNQLPALTIRATLFGTYGGAPVAGSTVLETLQERAQAVNGTAQTVLERTTSQALCWNQRFDVASWFGRWLYRSVVRAAHTFVGAQLNQYLLRPPASDEGLQLAATDANAPLCDVLTSRGPLDLSAAHYVAPLRRRLGLEPRVADELPSLPLGPLTAVQQFSAAQSGQPREIVVLGMQHGGVPAVMQWLLGGISGRWVYLHNQRAGAPVFRAERAVADCSGVDRSTLVRLNDAAQRRSFDGTIVHSYLDEAPGRLAEALRQQPPLVGRPSQRTVLLIVRDLPNLYAVRRFRTLRRDWMGQLPVVPPHDAVLRRRWMELVATLYGGGPQLPQLVTIHTAQFLTDAGYRQARAEQLGLTGNPPLTARSSSLFDAPPNEEERAELLLGTSALDRWRAKQDNAGYRAFFQDDRLVPFMQAFADGIPALIEALDGIGPPIHPS